jgi:hypothetical protein
VLLEKPTTATLAEFDQLVAAVDDSGLADGRAVFFSEAARTALGWNPTRAWRDQMPAEVRAAAYRP